MAASVYFESPVCSAKNEDRLRQLCGIPRKISQPSPGRLFFRHSRNVKAVETPSRNVHAVSENCLPRGYRVDTCIVFCVLLQVKSRTLTSPKKIFVYPKDTTGHSHLSLKNQSAPTADRSNLIAMLSTSITWARNREVFLGVRSARRICRWNNAEDFFKKGIFYEMHEMRHTIEILCSMCSLHGPKRHCLHRHDKHSRRPCPTICWYLRLRS
jgi:hypothetical protein